LFLSVRAKALVNCERRADNPARAEPHRRLAYSLSSYEPAAVLGLVGLGLGMGLALALGDGEGEAFGVGEALGDVSGVVEGEACGDGEVTGVGRAADGSAGSGAALGEGEGVAFERISSRRFKICSRFQSGTRKTHFSNFFSFSSRSFRPFIF
jgi:hypothetical protein